MSRRILYQTARQVVTASSSRLPMSSNAAVIVSATRRIHSHSKSRIHRRNNPPTLSHTRGYASQTLKFKQSNVSVEEYQKLSDQTFDSLTDSLEELTQEYDGEDADDYEVDYSNGVINLRLAHHGTYVINKQPANKQIWFSSPTSGPKRFDFDEEQQTWFMLKDGEESNLRDLLDSELSKIFGKEVKVNLGER